MSNQSAWDRWYSGVTAQFAIIAMGAVRVTLLFGSAAVALALIAVPAESKHSSVQISGADLTIVLDRVHTGAIPFR